MLKLLLVVFILLLGCSADNATIAETTKSNTLPKMHQKQSQTNEQLGPEISISAGETLTYQNLNIRVTSVEDSRCPIGEQCIWAGQMVVTLEVSGETGKKEEVKLIRKREPEMVSTFGYSLFLLDVQPHPKKGQVIQLSEQVVKVKIQ